MNDINKKMYIHRALCDSLGYIPPIAPELDCGHKFHIDETFIEACRGKCPEIDDKDNGDLPDLTMANFSNEGEPTYMLSGLKFRPIRTRLGSVGMSEYDDRYRAMNRRCQDSNNHNYKNYGGRGIMVCDAWHRMNPYGKANYLDWLASIDMSPALEVDRRDGNGHYCPDNCRAVTPIANSRNKDSLAFTESLVNSLRKEFRPLHLDEYSEWIENKAKELGASRKNLIRALHGERWPGLTEPPVKSKTAEAVELYKTLAHEFKASKDNLFKFCKKMAKVHRVKVENLRVGISSVLAKTEKV